MRPLPTVAAGVIAAVVSIGLPTHAGADGLSAEQHAFWQALREHCGNAYAGHLSDATPYYASAFGSLGRPLLHVRECTEDRTHLALHFDGDHSRNLLLTREPATGTLRLKHDHRERDGSASEITQYGGDAPKPGLPTRQIFQADAHTAEILPDRFDNFWFLDIVSDTTLAYGVHWPQHGHSIRLEFDTSAPVSLPPPPWGHE